MINTHAASAAGMVGSAGAELDALAILNEIVGLGREWIQVHEEETTKRTQIIANANERIAEIHALQSLFLTYLDKSFDERERNFTQLFTTLDTMITTGAGDIAPVLASITTLALKSPFADLHDPAKLRSKLADPDAEWEV